MNNRHKMTGWRLVFYPSWGHVCIGTIPKTSCAAGEGWFAQAVHDPRLPLGGHENWYLRFYLPKIPCGKCRIPLDISELGSK